MSDVDVTLALTGTGPWWHAFLKSDKRAENRGPRLVAQASKMIGTRIALHNSGTYEEPAADWIEHISGARMPTRAEYPRFSVVGTARIAGVLRPGDATPPGQGRWYEGAYAIVFDDVRTLREPAPVKGNRGFWKLPPDVAARVRDLEAS